jgi:hypothetical protein
MQSAMPKASKEAYEQYPHRGKHEMVAVAMDNQHFISKPSA